MNWTVMSASVLCLLVLLAGLLVYSDRLLLATWVVLASPVMILLILSILVRRHIRPRIIARDLHP